MESDSAIGQSDPAGAETLAIMSAAPRYNVWQYGQIERFIGRRVLEVGAGVGNMSQYLVTPERELVILTDPEESYLDELRRRFASSRNVRVERLCVPEPEATQRLRQCRLDTVVALNVVEHIEDDVAALRQFGEIAGPSANVIVLVPALPGIYGSLDRELGHYRRYTRATLSDAFAKAGLIIRHLSWFNRVGVLGWWFNARIRRASRIPLRQLRLFDIFVPVLRAEKALPLPFGQSLVAIGNRRA